MVDKLLYNTILSQTFSSCGNYMLAGNIFGDVAIYDLQKILAPSEGFTVPVKKAEFRFSVGNDAQVCSMVSTPKFLVTGSVAEICGWDWKTVTSNKNPKQAWTIQIPISKDILERADVNSMVYSESSGLIYAGCGDNIIYVFSLEDGKLVRTLEGHEDYIHNIHQLGNQMASASEDGSVRLWDLRQSCSTNAIHPHQNPRVARPELGKWVGAVSLSDDWLVCGGGPKLSLWHLRSLDATTVFPLDDRGIHIASFYDDCILAGGTCSHFYQFSYTGDTLAQIPSSSTTVYSAIFQETPFKVLCIAGSSAEIDFCTNFSYRDQVLSFLP